MKNHFQNYFRDWSNLLSFALALIPSWLMYKYPPRAKVPFYAIVLIILITLLLAWLNIKQWLDTKAETPIKPFDNPRIGDLLKRVN